MDEPCFLENKDITQNNLYALYEYINKNTIRILQQVCYKLNIPVTENHINLVHRIKRPKSEGLEICFYCGINLTEDIEVHKYNCPLAPIQIDFKLEYPINSQPSDPSNPMYCIYFFKSGDRIYNITSASIEFLKRLAKYNEANSIQLQFNGEPYRYQCVYKCPYCGEHLQAEEIVLHFVPQEFNKGWEKLFCSKLRMCYPGAISLSN